ncbi:MAG TPA: ABC transporter permease [Alphaproteobacteria bacterium]
MLIYIVRRILYAVPVALGVALVVFMLVHLAPGDPISAILPPDAPQELVIKLTAYYGFDKPLPIQFFKWLSVVLTGDLGTSIATGRPVAEEVGLAFSNTLILATSAALLSFAVAALLGTIAAYTRNPIADRAVTAIAVIGVSVPHYWLAMVLVIIFAVELGMLPPMGIGPENAGGWRPDPAHLAHMVLPTIALAAIPLGIVTRTIRATIREQLNQEFVIALRAKGLTHRQVMAHVVKNAAPTCLAVMGLQLGNLIGGSILIETVFAWPGTGFLLNSAIFRRDLPVLQGTTLLLAMFFVSLNLVIDLFQTRIDPRIKRA